MKEPVEITGLRKVAAALEKELDKETDKLTKLHVQVEIQMQVCSDVRRKWQSVTATVRMLTNEDPAPATIETVVEDALAHGPQSLESLQSYAIIRGFSKHAVRKALRGIAFGRTDDGKYTLQETLLKDRARERGVE